MVFSIFHSACLTNVAGNNLNVTLANAVRTLAREPACVLYRCE